MKMNKLNSKNIGLTGVNVTWRKQNSLQENVTFIMALNHQDAHDKVLAIKGSKEKIVIIKAQSYDRVSSCLTGEPTIYST